MHLSFTEFSFAEVRMQPKLTVGGQEDRVWGLGSCVEEVCSLCVCVMFVTMTECFASFLS